MVEEFLKAVIEQNEAERGYFIQLNSDDLDSSSRKCEGIEFSNVYFTECSAFGKDDNYTLCFENTKRKPLYQREDGTDIYPVDICTECFINMSQVERVEQVADVQKYFVEVGVKKGFNLYMLPEASIERKRNIVTVGLE